MEERKKKKKTERGARASGEATSGAGAGRQAKGEQCSLSFRSPYGARAARDFAAHPSNIVLAQVFAFFLRIFEQKRDCSQSKITQD